MTDKRQALVTGANKGLGAFGGRDVPGDVPELREDGLRPVGAG